MNNLCLVPFIGLPASGKTTTALELVKYCTNINFIYVPYDLFQKRLNLHVIDYKSGKYKEFRQLMLQFIEAIVMDVRAENLNLPTARQITVQHGFEWDYEQNNLDKWALIALLIDDNNYYRSMRYEVYQIARKYEIGFLSVYLQCTLEKALSRNGQRYVSDRVPDDIIRTMNVRLEMPCRKNAWEKVHCTINTDEERAINIQTIFQLIMQQTENPEAAHQSSRIITAPVSQSRLHQIDIYLRKLISQYLQGDNHRVNRPEELNMKRKKILADLRNHVIEVPLNLEEINEYFVVNN